MKIKYLLVLTLAVPLVLVLSIFFLTNGHGRETEQKLRRFVTINVADKSVIAEIANTPEKRSRGLMFIQNLPENEGMLFIFEAEGHHSFWMKNTVIPLDIIWLDREFSIVDISSETPPCKESNCPTYSPVKPALYVLELNGGWTLRNNLKIGDKISIVE
ncbi:DUF192 domain-containing protein [candidate division WWE3 bacterium]|jgi:uncharacterized membrane protein (UPF0127 family)|uniref:DUF192 domain-containing protein n=1 Tax=candidate division WWE3 bacterium TaxID=2053526 RepID=A0A3A4ZJS0_UNCKA|nr:MAG: DUF192 domain-containing protein [candidate division WWE3 bacterium]